MRYSAAVVRRAIVGDFRLSIPRTGWARLRGKRLLIARGYRIKGLKNLELAPGARLLLGTPFYGFVDRSDRGLLRLRGRLRILGYVKAAAGCRFDVADGAVMSIGAGTYLSPNVRAVVSTGLTIGRACAIAWDVQFLDDDFHGYWSGDGPRRAQAAPIHIGDHVWIGSGARIYKGVSIADGCVVAAGATVTRSVSEPNSLIGGSPATVLRSRVSWT